MSNVLIGIIGVILFIGLALAGALILGDDFKSASASGQAAALMSQIKQAADAADMRRLKLGVANTPSTNTAFLVPRFLKTPAMNPTRNAAAAPNDIRWMVSFNNNMVADGFDEAVYAAKFAQAVIGPQDDERSKRVCLEIAQTYGMASIENVVATADPQGDAGCALTGSGAVFDSVPQYVAFVRIAPRNQNYILPTG
jgi:hypothetical protein